MRHRLKDIIGTQKLCQIVLPCQYFKIHFRENNECLGSSTEQLHFWFSSLEFMGHF